MEVILQVPVPNFVCKYITAKHGHPWRLNSRYLHGRMMQEFLERTPKRNEKYKNDQTLMQVIVPTKIHLTKGSYLSQAKIDSFVEIIYFELVNEIENFYNSITSGLGIKKCKKVRVLDTRKDGSSKECRIPPLEGEKFFAQKEIIQEILKKYDISEDDLTYDAVIKKLQRSINRKK